MGPRRAEGCRAEGGAVYPVIEPFPFSPPTDDVAQIKEDQCSGRRAGSRPDTLHAYKGTPLTGKCTLIGPYRRPTPRVLGGS